MSAEFVLGDDFARVLTETTQALVCVLDSEGRILLFNDACERATGFRREEVIGRDARESVIPPEEAESFGDVLAYIWKTGLPSPQVGNWATKDGNRRLIAWSNRLMPADDGDHSYLVTTGLDLTRSASHTQGALIGDVEAKLAEVGRLAQEQRALRRVATLVASEATPERVFTAVSEESARVLEVNAAAVFRFEGDDTATIVGTDRDAAGIFGVGDRIFADDNTAVGQARDSRLPARIEDYLAVDTEVAARMRGAGYRSSVAAPIFVGGVPWGAVAIAAAERLPADSEARLMAFCELVSLAVASAQAREDLQSSRARIVKAGDEQRRRLERNLHDGAQQRLVSVALTLRLVRSRLGGDPSSDVEPLLDRAADELDNALEELRELARGLHPAALTEQGLSSALRALAHRLPIEVKVQEFERRLPEHLEATAYYIGSEALTNVAKHAQATSANVTFSCDGEMLRFEITDDGCGGADPRAGSGILGLRDRAEAAGGLCS